MNCSDIPGLPWMRRSTKLGSMTPSIPASLQPPARLLCGPGPSNVEPAALAAMQRPMLGHLDPDFHDILLEVIDLLRAAYRASGGLVFPLQATGTSGMEAGIANLVEPGERVIVGTCGFFGRRIAEIARRHGADVIEVDADWGEHVQNERLLDALDRHPGTRLLAVVHAETSSGVEHPLAELGAAMRGGDTLLMADCVTSLGGIELDVGAWGVDYAYSCTQKCLGAPPGMSPIAVSERAVEHMQARKTAPPFSLDLRLLEGYWVQRPVVYHHTAPILHIYALHEALRQVLAEGLEARWRRHAEAGAHLQRELTARGFELLADPDNQLAPLTAVRLPDDLDGKAIQTRLLREHDIEIGGGLGPVAPAMWRIGLMGHNATIETADRVLSALDAVLADRPVLSPAGA
jgi:alanine-glyoxylate transaminase / serine-glyoxylate transaminase / serine-pyruvate transaminase